MAQNRTTNGVAELPVSGAAIKSGRSARGADRRRKLIDAAALTFRAKGYDATSLQDIADAVGIQKGSLYHYIETKEDLLYSVVDAVHTEMHTANSAWREAEAPLDRIRAFVEGHVQFSIDNLVYAEVYFRDFRALSEERKTHIIAARDRYEGALRSLVEDAIAQGVVREGITPAMATRVLFGMMNWLYYWYRPDGPLSPEEIVAAIRDYALASLQAPVVPAP